MGLGEIGQGAAKLAFRNADGDAARELVMVGRPGIPGVSQVSAGQSGVQALSADGSFRDVAIADVDGDGLEDVVAAGFGLLTILATGATVAGNGSEFEDIELWEEDGVVGGVAMWFCPYEEGCGGPIEVVGLFEPDGTGKIVHGQNTAFYPAPLAALGANIDGARRGIIDQADRVSVRNFPENYFGSWHLDKAVVGNGALAAGDLVAGGSDELLRLSTGSPLTIATQWALVGEELVPGARGTIAGELDLIALGDLDGDGVLDAALAGDGRLVLWMAPALPASPTQGCITSLPIAGDPSALAVGDHDGDGRNDVAIAMKSSVTVWKVVP